MATLNVSGVSSERFYLTANTVLTLLDGVDGQSLVLIVTEDSIGGHTFSIVNSSGVPSILTTANTSTILQLVYDSVTGNWIPPMVSSTSGSESANTVYAGPASGVAALPAFRALVAADLPGTIFSVATLTLTSAQIKALHGTPVQIGPAPGTGQILLPFFATAQYRFGTLAYSNVTNALICISPAAFLGGIDYPIEFPAAGLIDQTANTVSLTLGETVMPQADWENQALVVANEGGSGEFTTGDGTLVITLWYTALTLS
jgi:hypothetical protein